MVVFTPWCRFAHRLHLGVGCHRKWWQPPHRILAVFCGYMPTSGFVSSGMSSHSTAISAFSVRDIICEPSIAYHRALP